MEKYDYKNAVCEDIRNYIEENHVDMTRDEDELFEELYDHLWTCDSVTGNGSGSYTFNTWRAEENLCHNMDLLVEACREFDCEPRLDSAEWCDVTIRCYLLGQCLTDIIEEYD